MQSRIMRAGFLLALGFALAAPAPSPKAQGNNMTKFLRVDTWVGTFSVQVTLDDQVAKVENGDRIERSGHWSSSYEVSVEMKRVESGELYHWEGQCSGTGKVDVSWEEKRVGFDGHVSRESSKDSGRGQKDCTGGDLYMHPSKPAEYELIVPVLAVDGTIRAVGNLSLSITYPIGVVHTPTGENCCTEPLPNHLVLDGQHNFEFNADSLDSMVAWASLRDLGGKNKVIMRVSWHLTPKGATEPETVIVPPDNYQRWMPEAGRDELTPGNSITVKVVLQKKGAPGKKPVQEAKFVFELVDVSKEKGVCVNAPPKAESEKKDEFDLKIRSEDNALLDVAQDGQRAESDSGQTEASVTITSFDWGAYGKLKVIAKLNDGSEQVAHVQGDDGKTVLTIPLDDNGNHVADAWEKEKGIWGKDYPANWDEDPEPAGQRRNGDGYTLYEEYRGFMTLDGHVRTDPLHKDLFVYDPDGLFKQYYEPFNPAQLNLHYIDETMMVFSGEARNPENRWVNFNSSAETMYARQYALYIRQWTTMSGSKVGEAASNAKAPGFKLGEAASVINVLSFLDELNGTDYAADAEYFREPLKSCYLIKVAPGGVEKSVAKLTGSLAQSIFQADMTQAVIHEVGHCIGIHHHEIVDGGVLQCAMRYRTDEEQRHARLLQPLTTYCRAGQTWQRYITRTDKEGNKTAGLEVGISDNCWGQIDVKSDP